MNELIQFLIADPDRTNAVAAIANVVLAVLALVVAVVSIALSVLTLKRQTLHNKLSVRPIPFVACADYLDRMRVKIYNNGTGPLLVKSFHVSNGAETKPDLISWMPPLPENLYWTHFTSAIVGRSVQPNDGLNLIELIGDLSDERFVAYRNRCRDILGNLTVTLQYSDIYGDKFDPCSRTLDWFAR